VHQIETNGAEIVLVNMEKPPLDEPRVRRALELANNQALHIKAVYSGSIPMVHHPFGTSVVCGNNSYPDHDLNAAKQHIAEYGQPVEIELLHTSTSRGRQTGELMQQLYKQIGVILKPVPLSTAPHVMQVVQKDYQLATWRIPSTHDHGPQLYRSFSSNSPANFTGYNNPVMDEMLDLQRRETNPEKRRDLLCRISALLNQDVPLIYRGGRRYHIIARKKIIDLVDIDGIKLNLSTAWIDELVNFNPLAYEIEQKSSVSFECPDPGDTEAIKAVVVGDWHGKDDWGAAITASFSADGMVVSQRKGSNQRENKYIICGSKIFWEAGDAKVLITLKERKLEGYWEKAGYKGSFILEKDQGSGNTTQRQG
jgi:hypothetical protein